MEAIFSSGPNREGRADALEIIGTAQRNGGLGGRPFLVVRRKAELLLCRINVVHVLYPLLSADRSGV